MREDSESHSLEKSSEVYLDTVHKQVMLLIDYIIHRQKLTHKMSKHTEEQNSGSRKIYYEQKIKY